MSNLLPSPSKVAIGKVRLYTFDNIPIPTEYVVTEINFSQSMNSPAFTGSIKVQDNIGNLEKYPLRGEERLEIEITSNDTNTKKKLNLQVYRIDNVKINDANDGVSYYLHFVSKTSFDASKRRVIEPIRNNSINQAARDIFSKYFARLKNNNAIDLPFGGQSYTVGDTERKFILQPTQDLFKGIIPNYTPADAMHFLSTRAYIRDAGFTSCSYRFFETLDDYYFVSDDYLIAYAIRRDEQITLNYFPQVSKDTTDMQQQVSSIERLEYPVRVDSNLDLRSGGYANKVTEINFMRREYKVKYFNYFGHDLINSYDISGSEYIDSTGEKHTADSYIHTEEYARATFNRENAKQFLLFRDYGELGDIAGPLRGEQYMSEIAARRVSYQHHLQATSLAATLKGRLDIRPGNVIKLNIMELTASSERKINPQLSGNYLVHSTNHSIINEELTTNLNIMKYDWS
jgi:hypothetical protein